MWESSRGSCSPSNSFVLIKSIHKVASKVLQLLLVADITRQLRLVFVLIFRRKLKADIAAAFPSLSPDELSELIPNKEELNVVKIYAHKGDAVTLYVLHKNPLFFELEKRLYPTGKKLPGMLY